MATNNLFNQPLMNKYLRKYKKELSLSHSRKEAVLKWIKKLEKWELKDEVANYGNFSRIILEDILGYDYEENIVENVKEDYGMGLSEFAIKKVNKKFIVIELKGSDTDLDKPQSRKNDKRTPVDQAFDYAKRSGDIDWIFVSNYDEFRLYNWHKKEHQYISFKAEDLQNPETFKLFMLIFSKFSTIEHNLIEKLVSKTVFVERDLEAEFYKLYNETRLMLIAELEHIHPEVTREESVHNAQLILNRYIFICFAEDLGLLPEEISVKTIEGVTNLRGYEIWHNLNGLFLDVNKGSEFREEKIFGYNGGLFSEDLEELKIRDIVEDQSIFKDAYQKWKFEEYSLLVEEKLSHYNARINPIYKNLMTISTFNFSSEVDVNILGHIFENSIGEIEELKADKKGRRKKEGIFYTPEYITNYICRNTIIPYLSKSGKANTVEDLLGEYWGTEIEQLEDNVRKIRIVDPACGSGAFLNKAGDVLVEIHQAIRENKYKSDKSLMPFFDTIEERRKILLDNIYGVDLNEESVEITKLSLFLKVCKKGLKLPNLDNNIKCGNSIVDDHEYSINPFKWEKEFKMVFENGGFDIVIGNPPYVRQERIKEIKPYLKENYEVYTGLADLFVYFFEKGLNILKNKGMFSFICANKFTRTKNDEPIRKFILEYEFQKYIDLTGENIFEDVTTNPCIIIIKKIKKQDNYKININEEFQIDEKRLGSGVWIFEKPEVLDLRDKIMHTALKLGDIKEINFYYGIKTGFDKAFIIDEKTKNQLIKDDPNNLEIIKPLLRGKNIKKYKNDFRNWYIILSKSGLNVEKQYPSIYSHLLLHENRLKMRSDKGKYWYNLRICKYYDEFKKEKIIWSNIANKPNFSYSNDGKVVDASAYFLTLKNPHYDIKYIIANLNSDVSYFIFKMIGEKIAGGYHQWKTNKVKELPVLPIEYDKQLPFIEKVSEIIELNKGLINEIHSFKDWLNRTFFVDKFSQKLDKYYELSFYEFLTELNKKKVDTKQRKTQELLKKEFEESISKINPLLQEIEKTDKEINQMVYELYGLNDDEIGIIETSLESN